MADDSSEGLYLGVHEQMTALETELTDEDVDLAVFDGPLRGRNHPNGVGYVKTQHVQYLPDEQQPPSTRSTRASARRSSSSRHGASPDGRGR